MVAAEGYFQSIRKVIENINKNSTLYAELLVPENLHVRVKHSENQH